MSLIAELKRRNVFRVGLAYALMGWVLLQAGDFALDLIDAPNWVIQTLFVVVALGLPVALFFAWAFELTPEGIKREAEVDRNQSISPKTGRKLDRAIIFFLVLVIASLAIERFWNGGGLPETAVTEPPPTAAPELPEEELPVTESVAVLAFDNISPDPANEYFADGISEEILNVLAGLPDLRVIARTSAFSFKGSDATIAEIARELNVAHVLEGSVRKAGNRVRVTAQLIRTADESHLWSQTYDRDLDDIFAVQDEIARAIAGQLQLKLSPEQEQDLVAIPTTNVEAYNQFLLGRQLWHQRTGQQLRASADALQAAVELDPEFAEAWAALADALVLIPEYSEDRSIATVPAAREAVNRALVLKPDLPQALTTRAYLRFMYDYDWENAEKDFLRALELDPSYPTAHQWYGEFMAVRDRDADRALAQFRKASELDPLAPVMWHVSGWVASNVGRLEEAFDYYQQALKINPNAQYTYANLVLLYLKSGKFDLARQAQERFLQLGGLDNQGIPSFIDAIEFPTQRSTYLEFLDETDTIPSGSTDKAMIYMLLGEQEKALQDLQVGLETGDPYAVLANMIHLYEPLREDPRFQAHLANMNLWPPRQ